MKRTFTTLFAAFSACLLCSVGAKADVVSGTQGTETQLTPKPAFVIEYDNKIQFATGTEITKPELYSNIELFVGEVAVPFVVNFIKNDETGAKIGIIADDSYYFPSGASVVLKMPKFRYSLANEEEAVASAQSEKQVFNFIIESYTIYEDGFGLTSNAAKSIVVKSGNVLKLNADFACKQLIVESGAGVVVNENVSLSVNDTAYYMAEKEDYVNINMGYLINKGTYNAESSVFMRNIDYYETASISLPINSINGKNFTLTQLDKSGDYWSGIWSGLFAESFLNNTNQACTDYYDVDYASGQAFQVIDWYEPFTFRAKGVINNEGIYTFPLTAKENSPFSYVQYTRVCNPYQAPFNWRNIVDARNTDAKNIYFNNRYYLNDYYVYNTKSGLTTYDGPMSYGYLQPAMSNSGLYSNATSTVVVKKIDLISYKEVQDLYKDETPKYPYIRFYCEDNDNPKGIGSRTVAVAYFMNNKEYNSVYDESDINLDYEAASIYESEYYSKFPYLTLQRSEKSQNTDELWYVITPYTFKDGAQHLDENQDSVCYVTLKPFVDVDDATTSIKVGVLDYYLPGITFNCETSGIDFSLDNPEVTIEVPAESELGGSDGWKYGTYASSDDSKYKNLTLKFTKSKGENPPTSVKDTDVVEPIVVSTSNGVKIKGLNIGDICNVYSMSGSSIMNVIANNSELNLDIQSKGIYFVEIISNGAVFTKKVIKK
ncbi:MAG: T9SS type A sorting domain-containing protein [Bacteroidales bacterium]|nr:T9SS type A sorting domain-containing protein [Bacteroidales bacterium]